MLKPKVEKKLVKQRKSLEKLNLDSDDEKESVISSVLGDTFSPRSPNNRSKRRSPLSRKKSSEFDANSSILESPRKTKHSDDSDDNDEQVESDANEAEEGTESDVSPKRDYTKNRPSSPTKRFISWLRQKASSFRTKGSQRNLNSNSQDADEIVSNDQVKKQDFVGTKKQNLVRRSSRSILAGEEEEEEEETEYVFDSAEVDVIAVRLRAFYILHMPDKLNDIPQILERFGGREYEILPKVALKYDRQIPDYSKARVIVSRFERGSIRNLQQNKPEPKKKMESKQGPPKFGKVRAIAIQYDPVPSLGLLYHNTKSAVVLRLDMLNFQEQSPRELAKVLLRVHGYLLEGVELKTLIRVFESFLDELQHGQRSERFIITDEYEDDIEAEEDGESTFSRDSKKQTSDQNDRRTSSPRGSGRKIGSRRGLDSIGRKSSTRSTNMDSPRSESGVNAKSQKIKTTPLNTANLNASIIEPASPEEVEAVEREQLFAPSPSIDDDTGTPQVETISPKSNSSAKNKDKEVDAVLTVSPTQEDTKSDLVTMEQPTQNNRTEFQAQGTKMNSSFEKRTPPAVPASSNHIQETANNVQEIAQPVDDKQNTNPPAKNFDDLSWIPPPPPIDEINDNVQVEYLDASNHKQPTMTAEIEASVPDKRAGVAARPNNDISLAPQIPHRSYRDRGESEAKRVWRKRLFDMDAIVFALIDSERIYYNDLSTINDMVVEPLLRLIAKREIQMKCSSELQTFLRLYSRLEIFHRYLNEQMWTACVDTTGGRHPPLVASWEDTADSQPLLICLQELLSIARVYPTYEDYYTQFNDAMSAFAKELSSNRKLTKFLQSCDGILRGLSLESYLAKPLDRLDSYQESLKSICACLKEHNDPANARVLEFAESIQRWVKQLVDIKEKHGSTTPSKTRGEIASINRRLRLGGNEIQVSFMQPHRKLIHACNAWIATGSESYSAFTIIFNDALIIAKPRKSWFNSSNKVYDIMQILLLHGTSLEYVGDDETHQKQDLSSFTHIVKLTNPSWANVDNIYIATSDDVWEDKMMEALDYANASSSKHRDQSLIHQLIALLDDKSSSTAKPVKAVSSRRSLFSSKFTSFHHQKATVIQKIFRGNRGRKEVKRMRQLAFVQVKAAMILQRAYKEAKKRRYWEQQRKTEMLRSAQGVPLQFEDVYQSDDDWDRENENDVPEGDDEEEDPDVDEIHYIRETDEIKM